MKEEVYGRYGYGTLFEFVSPADLEAISVGLGDPLCSIAYEAMRDAENGRDIIHQLNPKIKSEFSMDDDASEDLVPKA